MRDCNIEELLSQENNLYPPSHSKNVDLQPTKRSDLLASLEEVVPVACKLLVVNCIVLHGAFSYEFSQIQSSGVFCRLHQPNFSKHILDTSEIFCKNPHCVGRRKRSRKKRRTDIRRRFLPCLKTPGNWQSFRI